MESPKKQGPAYYTLYWRRVRRLTQVLLVSWVVILLAVVIGTPFLDLTVYGVPLAYWMISSILLPGFLVLVLFYAWRMDVIESDTIKNSNECLNQEAASSEKISRPDSGDRQHETQSARGGNPNH